MPEARSFVLITRPEPGASETVARVAALGWTPVIAPVLEIRTLPRRLPPADKLQAIVITSGSAVPALPACLHGVPVFAVGDATASRTRAAGFSQVSSADGDARALAELVARSPAARPLLLVCGRGQGSALAADLRSRGFRVIRRVVYAAVPLPALPEAAIAALKADTVGAMFFFSAETARHCMRLLRRARLHEAVRGVDALAIGEAAAVALRALPWRRIRVAARPTQDAMLALLR